MKIILITLLSLLTLQIGILNAGTSPTFPDGIAQALKSGNAEALGRFFNSSIDVSILDKEDVYSQSQAEQIVKDFFLKHPAKLFAVIHEGGKEDAKYVIGKLTTGNGIYRVYFLLKTTNGKSLIHQLRIENEDEE